VGRILVRKAEAAAPAGTPLQPQLMLGGQGGSGMFLTPEKPISPHEAGMQAAMNSMGGRSYSPQQAEAITGRASRAAQMAGRYGGMAAMLGSGLKNIYDSSIQGQAPSLTGMATGAYGAQQFMKPLATRAGAQYGAQRGLSQAGRPQGEIDREIQEGMADTNQGQQEESNLVRNPILPRTAEGVAQQAAEQQREGATPASIGRAGLNVEYSQKPEFQGFGNLFDGAEQELRERQNRTRAGRAQPGTAYYGPGTYGPQIAPPTQMSVGRASNVLAGRTRPPINVPTMTGTTLTPENSTQTTFDNNQLGMSGRLESSLPDLQEQQDKQMEEQKERMEKEKEKQEEMQEEQRKKLAEEMNQQNLLGFGA
jgi:hypothetical protein